MQSIIHINPVFRRKDYYNPISGHHWSENIPVGMFEVSGGSWTTTRHRTIKAAIKEKELREKIDMKFPFIMPRSRREMEKARKLKLLD